MPFFLKWRVFEKKQGISSKNIGCLKKVNHSFYQKQPYLDNFN